MRAAVLHEYGTPRYGTFERPVADGDQIVLDVCAAGINPFDVMACSGEFYVKPKQLPCVVGLDGVGRTADGLRVYFEATVAPYGAAAERTLVQPSAVVEVPDDLDDAVAAGLGNAGLAAWLSLEWCARLKPGESVLVLGATGTVGRLAVQVAKLLGARQVVAAGRDARKLHPARQLGADACVTLGGGDTAPRLQAALGEGADVIIDLLWGPVAASAIQAVAHGGRYIQVGNAAGQDASIPAAALRSRSVAMLGYANYHVPREERHAAYRRLAAHAADGRIVLEVERVALADVATAWQRQPASAGAKLVLIPRPL